MEWGGSTPLHPPVVLGPHLQRRIFLEAQGETSILDQVKSARSCQKKKRRRRLRLIMHTDVASFNAAAKRSSKADQMQKMGVRNMKYQLIYSM